MQFFTLTQNIKLHTIAVRNKFAIGGLMFTYPTENTKESFEKYQFIKGEELSLTVINSQILSGSRIQKSKYKQVVFSECLFYACDFQGVTFENCIFENCSFEFSHLRDCVFKNCHFSDCRWVASSSLNSSYKDCNLELELRGMVTANSTNKISTSLIDEQHTTDIYIQFLAA